MLKQPALLQRCAGEQYLQILVPGAINSFEGREAPQARKNETLSALRRIRSRFPEAAIHYLDTGRSRAYLDNSFLTWLKRNGIGFQDLSQSPIVLNTYQFIDSLPPTIRETYTKSLLEAETLLHFVRSESLAPKVPLLKLSGRYFPTRSFPWPRPAVQNRLAAGFNVLASSPTYLEPPITNFPKFTRTVAWASKEVSRVTLEETWSRCVLDLRRFAASHQLVDLEHVFFRAIDGSSSSVTRLGVSGVVASTGQIIRL